MKTYLLKTSPAVEPNAIRKTALQKSTPTTTTATKPGPSAATPPEPALFISLDVHNDSIAVSIAPSESTEVPRYGILGGTHDDVLKLAKKLQAAQC